MREIKNMPKSGQFVMMWAHDGLPWAKSLRYKDGQLQEYNSSDLDVWEDRSAFPSAIKRSAKFFRAN